ncbi:MAG: glycosyltransferase family A protein, partial [Armatimonadota bacterium]
RSSAVLPATLASVKAQDVSDWECLLVDDGSPDDTLQVASRLVDGDPRFAIHALGDAHGSACPARNAGLRLAHPDGRYVVFLDHDDLLVPDALSTMAGLLDEHRAYGAVHGTASVLGDPNPDYRLGRERWVFRRGWPRRMDPTEPTTFESMATQPHIPAPGTVMCRRSALPAGSLFPEGKVGQLDYDGWLRMLAQGPFLFVDRTVLVKRNVRGNMTSDWRAVRRRILASRVRTAKLPNLSARRRRTIFVAGAAMELRDGLDYLANGLRKLSAAQIRLAAGRFAMALRLAALNLRMG